VSITRDPCCLNRVASQLGAESVSVIPQFEQLGPRRLVGNQLRVQGGGQGTKPDLP
jgi:hypothetical protein